MPRNKILYKNQPHYNEVVHGTLLINERGLSVQKLDAKKGMRGAAKSLMSRYKTKGGENG